MCTQAERTLLKAPSVACIVHYQGKTSQSQDSQEMTGFQ